MRGCQIVCECLIEEGVEFIFGIPGGRILSLYDVLPQYPQLKHVLMRHEQGAIHAADGYARASGKIGVCVTTSGPGATNLITGIATARMDSSPILAITGQVPTYLLGSDAFQEADITGITLPITKYRYLVLETQQLAGVIKEACIIARKGRPGPVVIDIPQDVLLGTASFKSYRSIKIALNVPAVVNGQTKKLERQLVAATNLLERSCRPVIIAGRGIVISGAYTQLKNFAEKCNIPVAATLLGLSALPQRNKLALGMLGVYGNIVANTVVSAADLIIAVGMRFDDRATGNAKKFAQHAKIIHIDIDPAEIDKNIITDVAIIGDAAKILNHLIAMVKCKARAPWLKQIRMWRRQYAITARKAQCLLPQYCIRSIYEATMGDATIVTGVGQHQMWVANNFLFSRPNTLITAGGLGPMGFGLPAGIGIQLARPGDMVWLIDGDGSFQMTMHELAVVVQEKLPLKIAIINNSSLGMVRQLQQMFYGGRYVETSLLGPDFVKIAQAYGISALKVTRATEVNAAIARAMAYPGPFLIDFIVCPEENVLPDIPADESLDYMARTFKKGLFHYE